MSAYQRYFSPEQVESDHKDIIISQLKAELFEMRKGQREYELVFERLADMEAHYFDILKDLDVAKAEAQREEEEQIHEINVLRGELASITQKNDDKARTAAQLNEDLNGLRAHLNQAEEETMDLSHQVRVLGGDGERLLAESQQLESQLNFLDSHQAKLLNECTEVEQSLAHETQKSSDNQMRIQELLHVRDSLSATLQKGIAQLEELRRSILELQTVCRDKEAHIQGLKGEVANLDVELQRAEGENQSLVAELQRQKDMYNDQLAKNTALYDQINAMQKEIAFLDNEIGKLISELTFIEQKFEGATALNADLVRIIEELKIAIHELTIQIQTIVKELAQISQQDEHIRAMLDRRERIMGLKQLTIEKIKQFAYTRTLVSGAIPVQPVVVQRTVQTTNTIHQSQRSYY